MEKPKHLAIDADLIIHRAASCAQNDYIIAEHTSSGRTMQFENRTEFWGHHGKKSGGWLGDLNSERVDKGLPTFSPDDFTIHEEYSLEPVENAYHLIKMYINGFLKACEAETYTLYIDGGKNFRHDLATILGYKANRVKPKPHYYEDVRNYCLKHHPCEVADGIESDDILSILGASGEAIQVSCDKDQKQTPSWIYDYDKSEKPFEVKEGVGRIWSDTSGKVRAMGFKSLCHQLITSDDVDNIKPKFLCKKRFGDKDALKLLDPLQTKEECAKAVIDLYKSWYDSPIEYRHWETGDELAATWDSVLTEMGHLLYMYRTWDDSGFSIERFEQGDM